MNLVNYSEKLADNIRITASGCHEWIAYCLPAGYGRTRFHGKNMLAHRLAWKLAHGPIPKGKQVCHKCDNPPCCNPEHLFLGTAKMNARDSIAKGRMAEHMANLAVITRFRRTRKLTEEQAEQIRSSDDKLAVLAERYGVSVPCVSMIRSGKRKYAPARP